MVNELWRYEQTALQTAAHYVEKVLESNKQKTMQFIVNPFRQRIFLWHHAECFEQSAIVCTHKKKEMIFVKTGICVI